MFEQAPGLVGSVGQASHSEPVLTTRARPVFYPVKKDPTYGNMRAAMMGSSGHSVGPSPRASFERRGPIRDDGGDLTDDDDEAKGNERTGLLAHHQQFQRPLRAVGPASNAERWH